MAIEVFNRYEHKYILTDSDMERLMPIIGEHMMMDGFCKGGRTYTIANLYYDTKEDILIRRSLDKPVYKEKLRMRAYGVPAGDDEVFLEIKKKYKKRVNKRRTRLTLSEAYEFCRTGVKPEYREYMNAQVLDEIEYFLKNYHVMPKVYIAYDRLAFFEEGNPDLRVSFDKNIRTRRTDLRLDAGDHGEALLPDGMWLMEIKTLRAKPLWLCEALSEYGLRRRSFSKYGTEFKKETSSEFRFPSGGAG